MAFGQDDDGDYPGKPVEEGKTYEVEIDDLGSKGDGIARVEGFVVFVPETDIGEKVEVEINSVGRKFAFGEVTERLGQVEDVEDDADLELADEDEVEDLELEEDLEEEESVEEEFEELEEDEEDEEEFEELEEEEDDEDLDNEFADEEGMFEEDEELEEDLEDEELELDEEEPDLELDEDEEPL